MVALVNPGRARSFAWGVGQLAKNDALDGSPFEAHRGNRTVLLSNGFDRAQESIVAKLRDYHQRPLARYPARLGIAKPPGILNVFSVILSVAKNRREAICLKSRAGSSPPPAVEGASEYDGNPGSRDHRLKALQEAGKIAESFEILVRNSVWIEVHHVISDAAHSIQAFGEYLSIDLQL